MLTLPNVRRSMPFTSRTSTSPNGIEPERDAQAGATHSPPLGTNQPREPSAVIAPKLPHRRTRDPHGRSGRASMPPADPGWRREPCSVRCRPMPPRARSETVGVDTGGTFTDLVRLGPGGELEVSKLASTPREPARPVIDGLAQLAPARARRVVHGTTVGLNALLSRRTARAALVTNRG